MSDQPTHAGRWLAHTDFAVYEADVREVVPNVFEALVHGYCHEFNFTCCMIGHFTNWTPDHAT